MSDEVEVVNLTMVRRDVIIEHIRSYSVEAEIAFADFIEGLHRNCRTLVEFENRRNAYLRDWALDHKI